jgi:hypothetical protein
MIPTTSSNVALLLAAILAASSSALAAPSAADMESARALFKKGMEARAAGRNDEALDKLKAAHALGRTPITGNELAKQYEMGGLIVEALETAIDVGRIPVAVDETERSADARHAASDLATKLKPRIPTLVIRIVTVSKTSAELVVTIDGKSIPAAAVGEPYRVDPGAHDVRAHYEGAEEVSAQVTLAERDSKTVELSPAAPKVVVRLTAKGSSTVVPAIIGFGIGGAGLVIGAITGVMAITTKNDLDTNCKMGKCPQPYFGKIDDANLYATVSTVGFVSAAIGTVFGFTWLLVSSSDSAPPPKRGWIAPDLGPSWVGAHGTF